MALPERLPRQHSRSIGDPEWAKVFASAGAADRWIEENDPEGVAWGYEVEGAQAHRSIWLYSPDRESRAIGDSDWAKLFASKELARKWVDKHDPNGEIWEYPVQG